MIYTRRLPLEGLCNARDLGGIPVAGGGVTRYGAFIRCEVPKDLTEGDCAFLRDYGVSTTLDLRGEKESQETPSRLKGREGFNYILCSMMDEAAAAGSEPPPPEHLDLMKMEWLPVYTGIVDRGKAWTRRTLTLAAEAEGCVLYHCFTGKDRTGILSALLLGLAGVGKYDVMADYALSMVYLRPFYETMPVPEGVGTKREDYIRGFYRTGPETMEGLLDHLEKTYGGVEDYVRVCGVEERVIARLREKLVG